MARDQRCGTLRTYMITTVSFETLECAERMSHETLEHAERTHGFCVAKTSMYLSRGSSYGYYRMCSRGRCTLGICSLVGVLEQCDSTLNDNTKERCLENIYTNRDGSHMEFIECVAIVCGCTYSNRAVRSTGMCCGNTLCIVLSSTQRVL